MIPTEHRGRPTGSRGPRMRVRTTRTGFYVRPRTLVTAMIAIVVIAIIAVVVSLILGNHPGRVTLADLSDETTATVGFAGSFPAEEDAALANPLGIAYAGRRLYVAESDAGRVAIFDERGGRVGAIELAPAKGLPTVYPASIAVADDRLAIVDNTAPRVIVVDAEPADPADVVITLGERGNAPVQPTAVAYADGEYFVADAGDKSIKVYDAEGAHVRTLGETLAPRLAFVGALEVGEAGLSATDSNAGRVVVIDPQTGVLRTTFPDRMTLPRGMAALGDGVLAIVDTFERSVFITEADGTRRSTIDAITVPDALLDSPRDAAWIDEDRRLYVTDATTGRVYVYNVRLQAR